MTSWLISVTTQVALRCVTATERGVYLYMHVYIHIHILIHIHIHIHIRLKLYTPRRVGAGIFSSRYHTNIPLPILVHRI